MHGWPDEVLTRGLHFTWLSDVKHLYFQSLLPSNHNIVGFEHLFSLRLLLPNTHKIIHTANTSEEEENPAQEIGDAAELKPKSHLSSPPWVYQERSTEHSNRIHLKSYSSLSHRDPSSSQAPWCCWVCSVLPRQQQQPTVPPRAAAMRPVCCMWHRPQQPHFLSTKRKPTTLKNTPSFEVEIFWLAWLQIKTVS